MRIRELRATARRRSLSIVAAALVCVGCAAPAGQGSQSPSGSLGDVPPASAASLTPTPTSSPASQPSATPALAFEAPAGVLPPNSLVIVTGDGLRIRETPGLSGPVMTTVGAGQVLWTGGSATEVDGIRWYLMSFAAGFRDWPTFPEGTQSGWVAAGVGDERYVELMPPRCPAAEPDLLALTKLTAWERLACFGGRPLTVTGTWGCPYCDGTTGGTYEPIWLANPLNFALLSVRFGVANPIGLRFPPESGLQFPTVGGSILRVSGHFNDPAATTCVISWMGYEEVEPLAGTAELYCREQFVVDSYEVVGTDPDYRTGY
jgi:hypothetical protein